MLEPVYLCSTVLSILSDSAYAVIIGLLLARSWSMGLTSEPRPRLWRRGLLAALAVYTCAHLARPWFLAASMSGATGFRDNLALIPSILTDTHQGRLWFLSSAAVILLLSLTLVRRHGLIPTTISVAALSLIAFTKAVAGHAGGDGDYTLTAFAQMLHILATAVWAGGVLISGFLVLPRLLQNTSAEILWLYGARLSRAATIAIVAVAISGIYTSDRELNNTLSGLWMSAWGKILITKVVFVLIALSLGAGSRFLCLGKQCSDERRRLFARLLFAEACAMVLILCLSGLLGNTAPAMPPMAM